MPFHCITAEVAAAKLVQQCQMAPLVMPPLVRDVDMEGECLSLGKNEFDSGMAFDSIPALLALIHPFHLRFSDSKTNPKFTCLEKEKKVYLYVTEIKQNETIFCRQKEDWLAFDNIFQNNSFGLRQR